MRRVRVLIALLVVGALLLAGAPLREVPAVAQGGGVGTAVPVTNDVGVPVGTITVAEVIDPFTGVNPDYPAAPGERYVAARVVFDADAGERFDIAPWTIVLQDDQGFLWNPTSMILPGDAPIPELSSQTLAAGSRVAGLVGFAVPEGATPARIFYQPVSSRLVLLAELLPATPPALGEAVPIVDTEGGMGTVTVTRVVDPFTEIDPTATGPEGARLVLVTLTYENPGEGRFFSEPYGLLVQDAQGNLWNSTYISRPDETKIIPDLTRTQLAPGDRITGALVFAVPDDVGLTGVYYSPTSSQLLPLAALGEEPGPGSTPAGAAATPAPTVAPGAASTDLPAVDPCIELEQWLRATRARIERARELSAEDPAALSLDELATIASEYADLAAAQSTEPVPATAEAVNKALVVTLRAYASVAPDSAEGDNATLERLDDRLASIETELSRIAGECGLMRIGVAA